MGISIHLLDDMFEMQKFVLGIIPIYDSQTAKNIKNVTYDMLSSFFDYKSKRITFV